MSDSLKRFFDGDIWWSFKQHPLVMIAAVTALLCILASAFAPLVAPHNPFDLKTLNLLDAFTPPSWTANGKGQFLLGTDDQGRDVLSTIMYGSRVSLVVGICAVLLAMLIGITLGLISGYVGGSVDAFIMRVADIQLSFPAILIASIRLAPSRTDYNVCAIDRSRHVLCGEAIEGKNQEFAVGGDSMPLTSIEAILVQKRGVQ